MNQTARAALAALLTCLAGCGERTTTMMDEAVIHASGLGQPEHLRLDERALVWANKTEGTIMLLDLETDEVRTLASGIAGPERALATNERHVYWAGWRDGNVSRVARGGGEPEVIATLDAEALPNGMVLTSTHVYWTVFGGMVQRAPIDGGAVEDLGWDRSRIPDSPIVVDDHLYVATSGGQPAIARLRIEPTIGDVWEEVATLDGVGGVHEIAANGTHVYGFSVNDALVFRVELGGGDIEVLAREVQPADLCVDGEWLFLTRVGGPARMALAGGPLEVLADDADSWSVAAGGGRLFWSSHVDVDSFDGRVQSMALPD